MHRRLSIILLIITLTLSIIFSISFLFGPLKRIVRNYKDGITGSYVTVSIYSKEGSIIAKYSGKSTYMKSTDKFTEIHMNDKKYFFSNVGVIIEEN